MQKLIPVALSLALATGCSGSIKLPAPLSFQPPPENRLRYRFAVPPPTSIEKHPLTLYARRSDVQKRIIRDIDSHSRFSTCVSIPVREAGDIDRELRLGRKKGADFLLRTRITRFEAAFQGRNGRIITAWPLAATFFGAPVAWDIDAKTWRGDAVMNVSVFDCVSGKKIYSSTLTAESFGNFSRHDEMLEMEFGKNYIRYALGRDIVNNLMVGLIEDLDENFTRVLSGGGEKADATPAGASSPGPGETPADENDWGKGS